MRQWVRCAVLAALLLVLLPAAAPVQASDEEAMTQRIAAAFPGSEADIAAMREDGYGWGIIIMVLHLAELSGQEVADIRAMFESGKGFGEIAEELGINPGELGRIVAAVMSGGRSEAGQETGEGAVEEGGKPEWAPGPPVNPGRP